MAADQNKQADEVPAQPWWRAALSTAGCRLQLIFAAVRQRPVAAGIVLTVLLAAVLGTAWTAARLSRKEQPVELPAAAKALKLLDAGQLDDAKRQALALHQQQSASYEDLSVATYVMGAVVAQEAASETNRLKQKRLFLVAARYLQESYERGFPPQRRAEGLYLLGVSLYWSGQIHRSLPVLQQALQANRRRAPDLHFLLARALSTGPEANYRQALLHLDQYLATPDLQPLDRDEALLEKSRLQRLLGDLPGSAQTLDQLAADSPLHLQAQLQRARLWLAEAGTVEELPLAPDATPPTDGQRKKVEQAISLLQQTRAAAGDHNLVAAECSYLLGVCQQRLGDWAAAHEQFSQTRRLYFETPVGLAAGLSEADMLRLLGRHDEATPLYVRILQRAAQTAEPADRWVSPQRLQRRARMAYRAYVDAGLYPQALTVAKAAAAVLSHPDALRWQADAYLAWAEALAQTARQTVVSQRQPLAQQSRRQFRQAGRLLQELAATQIASRQYPDTLWQSADSFLKGHDFQSAARVLHGFLRYAPRNRIPRAQVALGKALLALDRLDEAAQAVEQCIRLSPSDPSVYEARLVASQVYLEKHELDKAKAVLVDNLENGLLTPDSIEWRSSLLALGKILHQEGSILEARSRQNGVDRVPPGRQGLADLEQSHEAFQQAIVRLDEFVQRYGGQPGATRDEQLQLIKARYWMADAHRQAAKWPRKKLATVTIETTRAALVRQMQAELEAAARIYQQLEVDLRRRQDKTELSAVEQAVLRNSYFGRADALFDLGRYQQAISAYSSVTNRYHDQPEALEAFVQIAACYRRLSRPDEARGTLQQAKVILGRIDPKADFARTTRLDRNQWGQLLDWLSTL